MAPYHRTFGEVPIGRPLVYVNSLLNLAVAPNLNLAVALNQRSYAKLHKIESGPDRSIEIRKN